MKRKMISIYMDVADTKSLKALARKKRIEFSSLVRMILAEYLETQSNTKRTQKAAQKRGK